MLPIFYGDTSGTAQTYFNAKRLNKLGPELEVTYLAMRSTYAWELIRSIEASGLEFDAILCPPSSTDDVRPYQEAIATRWPVVDLSENISRKGLLNARDAETSVEDLVGSEFNYMPNRGEPNFRSVLIIDESCSTGKTIAAVQQILWRSGLPKGALVAAAVCAKMMSRLSNSQERIRNDHEYSLP
ncbi:hypothetical protein ASD03_26800 [Ensifer sp. Root127]|nr:hypothetical protein ASD03_26800 [Ensifer sp. Root127]